MLDKINSFRGDYDFLSNFYSARVIYDGITYMNSEAAFQAQKCLYPEDKLQFSTMSPSNAKKAGHRVQLRPGWEEVKVDVMRNIVYAKFIQNPELADKLLATGDTFLEEGNTWGDRTWGTVNGVGNNYLGKILMGVRSDIRALRNTQTQPTYSQSIQQTLDNINNIMQEPLTLQNIMLNQMDRQRRACTEAIDYARNIAAQYKYFIDQNNIIQVYVVKGILQRDENGFYHIAMSEQQIKDLGYDYNKVKGVANELGSIEELFYNAIAEYKHQKEILRAMED